MNRFSSETNATGGASLSVVVVTLVGRSSLARCLGALAEQVGVQELEIVVPVDEARRDLIDLKADFPDVRFLQAEGRRTYAELRALGATTARGAIIAVTEDHCRPAPEWAAQLLREHAHPHAAIGGVVEKAAPDKALNWALYMCDYLRYMSPVEDGPTASLTDCNVSYKRGALESVAAIWRDEFHEPLVHAALRERGESLWLSSKIVVHQQRSETIGSAVSDRFRFGRLFGSQRVASLSPVKRAVYLGLGFLLPALLIWRMAGCVLRKRRCAREFLRAFPHLALLATAWSAGELTGYLTGRAGRSLTPRARAKADAPTGLEAVT